MQLQKKIMKTIHQSLYYPEQGQNNEFIEHKANEIESHYEPLWAIFTYVYSLKQFVDCKLDWSENDVFCFFSLCSFTHGVIYLFVIVKKKKKIIFFYDVSKLGHIKDTSAV